MKAVHDRDVLFVLFPLEQLAEPRRRALTTPSKPIPPATVDPRRFRRAVTPATTPRAPAAQLSSPYASLELRAGACDSRPESRDACLCL